MSQKDQPSEVLRKINPGEAAIVFPFVAADDDEPFMEARLVMEKPEIDPQKIPQNMIFAAAVSAYIQAHAGEIMAWFADNPVEAAKVFGQGLQFAKDH